MSQRKLAPSEIRFLQEALSADYKDGNLRLREGEYQYDLVKAISTFQLDLNFPNVKDIIRRLYGEDRTNDIQFVRKVQTILKKLEKSNIVRILPKGKPWELQRYALSSFKFRDIDKNLVVLATEQEIKQMRNLLQSVLRQEGTPMARFRSIKVCMLVLIVVASYATILWDFTQSIIDPIIFVPAFSIAVVCSLMLGKVLSRE